MCCQDTFSHVGCAASGGQDTSLSQSRGHMRDSLFCPAANIANLSQKHTRALQFYSLSPAIKRLHFRIVQISEDIITKYLIQIPATLLSQWINSSWKKNSIQKLEYLNCVFSWKLTSSVGRCRWLNIGAVLWSRRCLLLLILMFAQMTHYKCSINPRSNILQLTANTLHYFLCYLSGVRHMFAQY